MSGHARLHALLFIAVAAAVSGMQSSPALQYYRELNCSSVSKAGVITAYDCGILNDLKKDQCFYNGKHYKPGEHISRQEMNNPCIVQCTCNNHFNDASFSCVHIECPSLFRPPVQKKGCFDTYTHGECCSVATHCEGEDPLGETCQYGGKTYRTGEAFYPEDNSCTKCICGPGFTGLVKEPWCQKITCDMYLHYGQRIRDGCVPTYYKPTDCCPIPEWRCPSENDKVLDSSPAASKSKEATCKFGQLELSIGQRLSPSEEVNKCNECSCEVPPHVSCVMNTTCYEAGF